MHAQNEHRFSPELHAYSLSSQHSFWALHSYANFCAVLTKLAQLELPEQSTISTAVLICGLCTHKMSTGFLLSFMLQAGSPLVSLLQPVCETLPFM